MLSRVGVLQAPSHTLTLRSGLICFWTDCGWKTGESPHSHVGNIQPRRRKVWSLSNTQVMMILKHKICFISSWVGGGECGLTADLR